MAEEIGSTRESLAYNPGRETVHADPKTGEPEVFLEPLLWGLFSLGGFITAFLFPITVFLLFLAPVFGLWPTDPAAYVTFAAHWRVPSSSVLLFSVKALSRAVPGAALPSDRACRRSPSPARARGPSSRLLGPGPPARRLCARSATSPRSAPGSSKALGFAPCRRSRFHRR